VLKFVSSQYDGVIPDGGDEPGPLSPNDALDAEFITEVNRLLSQYIDALEAVKLRLGLEIVMAISARGNNYLQSSGLNKALLAANRSRCAQVISRAINLIYVLSVLVYPYMPATSESILSQLNAPARAVPEVFAIDILEGHTIGKPTHLFGKIDEEMVKSLAAKFAGDESKTNSAPPDQLKTTPDLPSKRKAAVAAKGKAKTNPDLPKTPEMEKLEKEITAQGMKVRELKGQTPKDDAKIKNEVDVLKALKAELEKMQASAAK
jgi:methionyl-tRNA synthetase